MLNKEVIFLDILTEIQNWPEGGMYHGQFHIQEFITFCLNRLNSIENEYNSNYFMVKKADDFMNKYLK